MSVHPHLYAEHPQDVLRQWLEWRAAGPVALVVVTQTAGGSVRAPGALMAVRADGVRCGYISGGCIDQDVALRAVESLTSGTRLSLRYGAGSPFLDMPLPCGGAIDLQIFPDPPRAVLQSCHDELAARKPSALCLPDTDARFSYLPKLRVRIAGRGADALALARLVVTSGADLVLQLRSDDDVQEASALGLNGATALGTPASLPEVHDDAWTAFVLMFHDSDWETALLKQALAGDAFYIGAVGSQRTQDRRHACLLKAGLNESDVRRIRGPIGLVSSMRSASMLAVSVFAEIIDAFHRSRVRPFSKTALILLAAGASQRFEGGDKLLADLKGQPVLAHIAGLLRDQAVGARIAVVGAGQTARAEIAHAAGWDIIENPDAANGQATSLQAGLRAAAARPEIDHALILLADMPFISAKHLAALQQAAREGAPAVLSCVSGALCPPAIVTREFFPALMNIRGDQGAKQVLSALPGMRRVALAPQESLDIDTREDLSRAALHVDP